MIMTTIELRNWLGVESTEDVDVEFARKTALEKLKRSTGKDWEKITNNEIANEAIRSMVYRSYWGVRDSAKNLEFLGKHILEQITTLQYSDDVEVVENGIQ